jgi:hypothetical protein
LCNLRHNCVGSDRSKIKDPEQQSWYVGETLEDGRSRQTLTMQIEPTAYSRAGNFSRNMRCEATPIEWAQRSRWFARFCSQPSRAYTGDRTFRAFCGGLLEKSLLDQRIADRASGGSLRTRTALLQAASHAVTARNAREVRSPQSRPPASRTPSTQPTSSMYAALVIDRVRRGKGHGEPSRIARVEAGVIELPPDFCAGYSGLSLRCRAGGGPPVSVLNEAVSRHRRRLPACRCA